MLNFVTFLSITKNHAEVSAKLKARKISADMLSTNADTR